MRTVPGIPVCLLLFAMLAAAMASFAEPATNDRPGVSLRWKNISIRIAVSSSLTGQNPNIKAGTDARDVIRRSLSVWENVSNIKFDETTSEKQSVSPAGISGDGTSLITIAQTPENLALFQNEWQSAPGRTRVFYNSRNEITEADIVLNPYVQFSDDGTLGTFDLQSTLTHEVGHLLGLGHSISMGSAMYANYGRNGLFGLQSRNGRTLSFEDVSALHAIYGALPEDDCCGQVNGRLTLPGGRPATSFRIWAEDEENGRVAGAAISGRAGTYRIEGLPEGNYRIYFQDDDSKELGLSSLAIGAVEIENGKLSSLNTVIPLRKSEMNLRYIGINSQLADAAIPVNAGRTYSVYLGGANISAANLIVGANSRFISVSPETVRKIDFSDKVSAVFAEITVDPRTPPGDYSIFVKSNNDLRYIIGGIAVESFVDPWDFSPVFAR